MTREQLEEIVAHGSGQQQIEAVALLEKMALREKAEASPEPEPEPTDFYAWASYWVRQGMKRREQ